jgi:hypothetical protein
MSDEQFLAIAVDKRNSVFFEMIKDTGELWILTDADGCVMLTTDDEDGVPVWPTQSLAKMWANKEWSECETKAISLDTWLKRWTPGLMQDNLAIMIAPVSEEEGDVFLPEEFAQQLLD